MMKNLNLELLKLKKIIKKYEIDGTFAYNKSSINISDTEDEIGFFYHQYTPNNIMIETGTTPLEIINFEFLDAHQLKYSFPKDHLIFMDDIGGGKPIVAMIGKQNTPIYASYEGTELLKIADSLSDFIKSFTILIDILYGKFDIFEIYNDDDELSQKFKKALEKKIIPIIGQDNFDNLFDYFYG